PPEGSAEKPISIPIGSIGLPPDVKSEATTPCKRRHCVHKCLCKATSEGHSGRTAADKNCIQLSNLSTNKREIIYPKKSHLIFVEKLKIIRQRSLSSVGGHCDYFHVQ